MNKKLTIKPGWREYLAQNLLWMLLIIAATIAIPLIRNDTWVRGAALLCMAGLILTQMVVFIKLTAVKWTIDDEQIARTMGVFSKTTDYTELYRVTDYQEVQTFMQRIFGVKTLIVISTDKTDGQLPIYGYPAKADLKSFLRIKVENNKRIHNVYEITNR